MRLRKVEEKGLVEEKDIFVINSPRFGIPFRDYLRMFVNYFDYLHKSITHLTALHSKQKKKI